MTQSVGILGLGGIGGTAARLLLQAGCGVHAVDRASAQWLPEAGGNLVRDAKELAQVTDIVVVSLASEDAVEEAYLGPNGLVAGGRDGLIVADMGTFAVAQKEAVKAAFDPTGAVMLDTPISGTPEAMETGRAVIMMSGDQAACEQIRPLLEVLAARCPYVGEFGTGMKLKFVLNSLVAGHVMITAEALLMGIRSGLEAQQIIDVVTPSVATSTQFELRAPIMAARNWQPGAPARLVHKDLHYIVDHAARLGVPAPISGIAALYFDKLAEMGRLDDELAAVFEALEADATADDS
ncbi:MAG: NAD(P)-dependent oxidoreductase [Alphaproteobacteria bacterium]|nr:NAD(P)-dependent oxidoreductase [Alphaproteobacteria bacterium]